MNKIKKVDIILITERSLSYEVIVMKPQGFQDFCLNSGGDMNKYK